MRTENAEPTTVGEMLIEEFLIPLKVSSCDLAIILGTTHRRIEEILRENMNIDKNEGEILAKKFHTDNDFWINLQEAHNIWSSKSTYN